MQVMGVVMPEHGGTLSACAHSESKISGRCRESHTQVTHKMGVLPGARFFIRLPQEGRRMEPPLAQEAAYLTASAKIPNLVCSSITSVSFNRGASMFK